ncbi:MAG: hypothetical protein L6R28_20110, partial [Planctomycetes bacterium]|nr:hypothetical protein [Planctomycetota bacterium]
AYLSCYFWNQAWNHDGHHGVVKVDMQSDAEPVIFAGSMKQNESGSENGKFRYATGIDVDAQGRVYVGDYMNDRVQVFDAEGKHLKNIPVEKPVEVCLHQKTGELYVFSWLLGNYQLVDAEAQAAKQQKSLFIKAVLNRLGGFDDPKRIASCPLPLEGYGDKVGSYMGVIRSGLQFRFELDGYSDPPAIWMVPGAPYSTGYGGERKDEAWTKTSLRLYELKGNKLELKRDFGNEANKAVEQLRPPVYGRQRLYVNPKTGNLYIGEGSPPDGTGNEKAFFELVEVNPETGKVKMIPMPYDAEDICFDQDGLIYLRESSHVGRFDFRSWREVPWDYGEEQESVGFSSGRGGKRGQLVAGLPVFKGINWHMGGLSVSKKGLIAVSCYTKDAVKQRTDERSVDVAAGTPYVPRIYPGRVFGHKRALIHVWDKHGQVKYEDAVPGLPDLYGLEIDEHDDLYLLSAATRVFDGKRYYNDMAGTLMKFRPKNGKVLSDSAHEIKLPDASKPKRPIDVTSSMQGGAWVEGAEWMFGGAGFGGKNRGVGCACWSGKFALDYYARSFAPETDRYTVAVLDSAGNVILRIGKYGNVDDGKPMVADGGPPQVRSLGGDEVGLFHGAYLATHSDRRLFIADPGNFRVLGVALNYHDERKVALKSVKDGE